MLVVKGGIFSLAALATITALVGLITPGWLIYEDILVNASKDNEKTDRLVERQAPNTASDSEGVAHDMSAFEGINHNNLLNEELQGGTNQTDRTNSANGINEASITKQGDDMTNADISNRSSSTDNVEDINKAGVIKQGDDMTDADSTNQGEDANEDTGNDHDIPPRNPLFSVVKPEGPNKGITKTPPAFFPSSTLRIPRSPLGGAMSRPDLPIGRPGWTRGPGRTKPLLTSNSPLTKDQTEPPWFLRTIQGASFPPPALLQPRRPPDTWSEWIPQPYPSRGTQLSTILPNEFDFADTDPFMTKDQILIPDTEPQQLDNLGWFHGESKTENNVDLKTSDAIVYSVYVGLWYGRTCKKTRDETIRKSEQLTALFGKLHFAEVTADTWNELRVETFLAVISCSLGLVGTTLTMKPLRLKSTRRIFLLTALSGMIVSCVLHLVAIARVKTIQSHATEILERISRTACLNTPWSAIICGISSGLALTTALTLGFSTWWEERTKWFKFDNDVDLTKTGGKETYACITESSNDNQGLRSSRF